MPDINHTKVFTELAQSAGILGQEFIDNNYSEWKMNESGVLEKSVPKYKYSIHLLRGGARSSKSYSLMQMVFIWLMTGHIGTIQQMTGIFAIVRNVLPALKATVLREFEAYLDIMKVAQYIDYRKTKNEFEFDERIVSFFPATDSQRLKGRQHEFVWINEANGLTFLEFIDLDVRCSGPMWLDYNPDDPSSYVKTELEDKRREKKDDVNLMVSTIRLNPFLSAAQRHKIESLIDYDKELYDVLMEGRWVQFKGLIFPNWEIITYEEFPKTLLKQCYSMDIGFNDATVLLHVVLEDRTLYIDEIFHETGLTTADVIKRLDDSQVRNSRIIADSQAASFIEEIKRRRYRIKPCKKGPDSLLNGIKKVKALKLRITDRSLKTMQELKRFKWKKDKSGDDTDVPLNMYKNAPDAIRYAAVFLTNTNTLRIL